MERTSFKYASCYCEENVWHLAADARIPGKKRYVVFISNRDRLCALWCQRSSAQPEEPVLWDYHVVLLSDGAIWDLDTRLDLPVSAPSYLEETFPRVTRFAPKFRVIDAEEFLKTFASDRSHMIEDGKYKMPPPAWPAIRTNAETMNLDRFIDTENRFVGQVFDLPGFKRWLRVNS